MGSDWSVPENAADEDWGETAQLLVVDYNAVQEQEQARQRAVAVKARWRRLAGKVFALIRDHNRRVLATELGVLIDFEPSSEEEAVVVDAQQHDSSINVGQAPGCIPGCECKPVVEPMILTTFRVPVRYLCSASPVMKAMLTGDTEEAASRKIVMMEGANADDVENFLEWSCRALSFSNLKLSYPGMTDTILAQILPLAQYYQVDPLIQYLATWVQKNATIHRVETIEEVYNGTFEVQWSDRAIERLHDEMITIRPENALRQVLKATALEQLARLRSSTVVGVMTHLAKQSAPVKIGPKLTMTKNSIPYSIQ